jgi:hypothetical protein
MRPVGICSTIAVSIIAAVGAITAGHSRADVFFLHNGGQVRGRWVNRGDRSPKTYVIETIQGGRLALDASQVRQAVSEKPAVDQYERIAAKFPDTIDGQWKLAEWCRENGLREQRERHLRRIIMLDPNHAGARRGLGYSQVRGQWVTREEIQTQRGYVLYDGRWRLGQEVDLLEAEKKLDQAEKEWLTRLVRWREMLGTERSQDAVKSISGIRDPHAVKGLTQLLGDERHRGAKMLYIDALARIGNRAAIQALFLSTLRDPDVEVFHACLDKIVEIAPPHIAEEYVKVLKDENNARLNRAAHALGRLNDESALSPLIDALITTHHVIIPKRSDAYTTTFLKPATSGLSGPGGSLSPLGGTSFSAGDETKVIPRTARNEEVLQALINLSGGVNFGFDVRAWKSWLANENRRAAPQAGTRRDAE